MTSREDAAYKAALRAHERRLGHRDVVARRRFNALLRDAAVTPERLKEVVRRLEAEMGTRRVEDRRKVNGVLRAGGRPRRKRRRREAVDWQALRAAAPRAAGPAPASFPVNVRFPRRVAPQVVAALDKHASRVGAPCAVAQRSCAAELDAKSKEAASCAAERVARDIMIRDLENARDVVIRDLVKCRQRDSPALPRGAELLPSLAYVRAETLLDRARRARRQRGKAAWRQAGGRSSVRDSSDDDDSDDDDSDDDSDVSSSEEEGEEEDWRDGEGRRHEAFTPTPQPPIFFVEGW